jgi:hypothetical protein
MAGNIIPAIATTNAIVAGVLVLQCLKALQGKWSESRVVWVSRANADKAISPSDVNLPNPSCAVCRTPYIHVKVNTAKLTVGTFVKEVVKDSVGLPGDVSLVEGSRIILDPDFDDNEDKTFEHMGLVEGTLLTVNDEEGDLESIVFLISKCVVVPAARELAHPETACLTRRRTTSCPTHYPPSQRRLHWRLRLRQSSRRKWLNQPPLLAGSVRRMTRSWAAGPTEPKKPRSTRSGSMILAWSIWTTRTTK